MYVWSAILSLLALSVTLSFALYILERILLELVGYYLSPHRVLSVFLGAVVFAAVFNFLSSQGLNWLLRARDESGTYLYNRTIISFTPLSTLFSFLAWLAVLTRLWGSRNKNRRALEKYSPTRFQIWLQDIFIAVLATGLSMTILRWRISPETSETYTIVVGAYRAASMLICFLFLINVCRYSPSAQVVRKRAWFVAVVMLICSYAVGAFSMPVVYLVWRKWLIRMAARQDGS
ncbi:MAG TPA: hypothetical protein VKX17_08860 [Planctomycetota bacterium]|nr:hypothetical protein [Planctomycetota bacterium]